MKYTSELDRSVDRFLSRCLQQVLGESWVTPADFVATFGPQDIMKALEGVTELRARILIEAAGVHERIAPKKSTDAAAEDLQIALEEGICDPPRLLELFAADDRVRYLDEKRLWQFLARDDFWKKPSDRARERMRFLVATALEEKLIELGGIIDGVGPERLASDLPKALLEQVLVRAVADGRVGKAFDPEGLFAVVNLESWVMHVPLAHLWQRIVCERIAEPSGWSGAAAEVSETDIAALDEEPPPESGPSASKARGKGSSGKGSAKGDAGSEAKAEGTSNQGALNSKAAGGTSPRDAVEQEAREQALESLSKIGRRPPRPELLDTPTLLAIESLYVDLAPLTTDEAREECIREAFPNEAMLRSALLALAEVLDPNIDIAALEQDADAESLIKLVLFEERRKADRSRRSLTAPPPTGSIPPQASSSPPPPVLPGASPSSGQRTSAPPPPSLPVAAGGPDQRRR